MSADRFTIRSYQPGDEFKINEMFNEVFNQKRDISSWYWKYRDNPYGSYIISLAFSSDGTLAAHYAGYPVKLLSFSPANQNPSEAAIYQLGDKMTRSMFRSVGFGKSALMTKTFAHFREAFSSPDVAFAYGFLTHHSLRFGLLFLNYTVIEPVFYRSISFDALTGLGSGRFRQITQRLKAMAAPEIDESWTGFFQSAAPFYSYLIKRDAAYMNWRYAQRPDKKYLLITAKRKSNITGWAVFCREGDKIMWGDALFAPNDADSVKAVLAHLYRHPHAKGVRLIECWFPPRPKWWDAILCSLGFTNGVDPNNLHFCITNVSDNAAPDKLSKYFYYTMGDSDLF